MGLLKISSGIEFLNPTPSDERRGPWASIAAAKAGVPLGVRLSGLEVDILGLGTYQWTTDLSDSGLLPKVSAAGTTIWTVAGTNTYTATITGITAYAVGQEIRLKFTNAPTGSSTLNINSLGAVPLQINGAAITSTSFTANTNCIASYDGTNFQLIGGGSETPSYPSAGIPVSTGAAWGTSITDNSTNWNTAFNSRISSFTTTGTGDATFVSNVLNIPNNGTVNPGLANQVGFYAANGTVLSGSADFLFDNTTSKRLKLKLNSGIDNGAGGTPTLSLSLIDDGSLVRNANLRVTTSNSYVINQLTLQRSGVFSVGSKIARWLQLTTEGISNFAATTSASINSLINVTEPTTYQISSSTSGILNNMYIGGISATAVNPSTTAGGVASLFVDLSVSSTNLSAPAYTLYSNGTLFTTGLRFGTTSTAGHVLTATGTDGVLSLQAPSGAGGATTFSAGTTGLTPSTATSGAVTLGGTLGIGNGGTNATTAQGAINNLAGAVTSGSYLRGNGTNVVMSAIQAADVPTLNQSTTGSAATLTTGRTLAMTGDVTYTSPAFNGSANVTAAATVTKVDNTALLKGSVDGTKQAIFNVSGITTATTRTYTMQNYSGLIPVYETGTSTLWTGNGANNFIRPSAANGNIFLFATGAGSTSLTTDNATTGSVGFISMAPGNASGSVATVGVVSITGGATNINSQKAGNVIITGGEATGTAANGGDVVLAAGAGTSASGKIKLQTGTAPTVGQALTASATDGTLQWSTISGGGGLSGLTAGRVALSASATTINDSPELTFIGNTLVLGTGINNSQFVIGGTGSLAGIYSPSYSTSASNILTIKDYSGTAKATFDFTASPTFTFNGAVTVGNLTTAGIVTNTAAGLLGTSSGTGFLKMTGGTISYDNSTYEPAFTSQAGNLVFASPNGSAGRPVFRNIVAGDLASTTGSGTVIPLATSPTISTSLVAGTASFDLLNAVATTINFGGAATAFNLGGTPTTTLTANLFSNATASGQTKTINIGGSGTSTSITNINIGSSVSGATGTINLYQRSNLKGYADGSAASAGNVGERILASVFPNTNFPGATGVIQTLTSITLTAGDWDIFYLVDYISNGSASTLGCSFYFNGNPALAGGSVLTNTFLSPSACSSGQQTVSSLSYLSLSSSATYYVNATPNYSAGTPQYQAAILAVRRR